MKNEHHTPGPWKTDASNGFPRHVENNDGDLIARCPSDCSDEIYGAANARRIVACVNACEGIPTELLEREKYISTASHAMRLEAEKQRDELLAVIEKCYKMLLSEPDTKGALFKAENIMREAIATAKESKK